MPYDRDDPAETSSVHLRRDSLQPLARGLCERFAKHCIESDESSIISAVARRGMSLPCPTDDEIEEALRCELLDRLLFPRWASRLGLDPTVAREDLLKFQERLYLLPDDSVLKRAYVALSHVQRCATRSQSPHAVRISAVILGRDRHNFDTIKGRALDHCRAGTCFDRVRRADLRDMHIFLPTMAPLRLATKAVLLHYCTPHGTAAGGSMLSLQEERNRLRRPMDASQQEAKRLWENAFATALDESGTRPIDLEAWFATLIQSQDPFGWQDLRVAQALPANGVSPATTWAPILGRSNRPPTWVLMGPWARAIDGRGINLRCALQTLIDAAEQADDARTRYSRAAENAYVASIDCPAKLKDAIVNFNRSLDEALTRPSKGRETK